MTEWRDPSKFEWPAFNYIGLPLEFVMPDGAIEPGKLVEIDVPTHDGEIPYFKIVLDDERSFNLAVGCKAWRPL